MKVSRLKRGWRIQLTDNEMDALRIAVEYGIADLDEEHIRAQPNGVRRTLHSARWRAIDGPLTLDDDRRAPSTPSEEG